jgi:hypothetical protein
VFDPLSSTAAVGGAAFDALRGHPTGLLLRSFKSKLDKQRLRQMRIAVAVEASGDYDFVNQGVKLKESTALIPIYDKHSLEEVIGGTTAILRHLLAVAAEYGLDDRFYVGVPVSFGATARKRVLRALVATAAFGSAGEAYRRTLERCRFVYEPLALASAAPLDSSRVLIIDYGGGTLDLAVLDVERKKELALGGLPRAGDHLDVLFRRFLLTQDPELKDRYEAIVRAGTPLDIRDADNAFTVAKQVLSRNDDAVVPLRGFPYEVSRADLEGAIAGELDGVSAAVDECVRRGGLAKTDIDAVILTGGSSLVPAVQSRLRDVFAHVGADDFIHGIPGDPESERAALTGVSRGLAEYGAYDAFETSAPCDYLVWSPDECRFVTCLPRGAHDEHELGAAPATRLRVGKASRVSFFLTSNLVRDTYCGALVDVTLPPGVEEVDVRVSASRDRFMPAFRVSRPGATAGLDFDLEKWNGTASLERIRTYVENDCEWLPATKDPDFAIITRPLRCGDFVEWRHGAEKRRGEIIRIRDVDANSPVQETRGFDPSPYRFFVAREIDGRVRLDHMSPCDWKLGDVQLI